MTLPQKLKTFLVVFLIIASIMAVSIYRHKRDYKKLFQEFPFVLKSDSLNGIIKEVRWPESFKADRNKSGVFLELHNGNKIFLNVKPRNEIDDNNDILLQEGFRIVKESNNDTIWVYKPKFGSTYIVIK
jgi:hypothetical protein